MTTTTTTATTTTWPWLQEEGLLGRTITNPPMEPVNEYDDRPSVTELIEQHASLIEQVRLLLLNDDPSLYEPMKHDDLWILRFLLSHKKKVKAAVKAAKYTLAFRKEHNLDATDIRYCTELEVAFSKEPFERYQKYSKEDAVKFVLPDVQRGVIGIVNAGGVDQHALVKNVPERDWLQCILYYSEWTHQWQDYITRSTGRLTKSIRFIDLSELKISGFNFELGRRDGAVIRTLEDCYPQLLRTMYVCDAPAWMQVPWRILRPFFPERFTSKFDFIRPAKNINERERLLKHISLQHLPARYGGLNEQWPISFPHQK
jgi:CRAL/TRIO domain